MTDVCILPPRTDAKPPRDASHTYIVSGGVRNTREPETSSNKNAPC